MSAGKLTATHPFYSLREFKALSLVSAISPRPLPSPASLFYLDVHSCTGLLSPKPQFPDRSVNHLGNLHTHAQMHTCQHEVFTPLCVFVATPLKMRIIMYEPHRMVFKTEQDKTGQVLILTHLQHSEYSRPK